ncbi:MAG: class I SAM-dependent methyltransferase [Pseudomonadota bacterium]
MTSDAENIVGLYRRHARAFADRRHQSREPMEAAWLDRFLALLPHRAEVLDIGCGTGAPMARHLLAQGCHVTGVDGAPELIEVARAAMPEGRWHVGDMRGLDLGHRYQGLLAWHSLFHLTPEDQRKTFTVLDRHAAPGAALMFTSGPEQGVAMGTLEGDPLYHASLDPAEYRDLLQRIGFDVLDHVIRDPDCGYSTIWLAQRRAD